MEETKETKKEPKPAAKKSAPPADVYTAAELAASHKVFKTSREIVAVALKLAKKEKATFEEAKEIVEEFKNRRVK